MINKKIITSLAFLVDNNPDRKTEILEKQSNLNEGKNLKSRLEKHK
jgi:hypothetical protein